jgi:hypothetical protein
MGEPPWVVGLPDGISNLKFEISNETPGNTGTRFKLWTYSVLKRLQLASVPSANSRFFFNLSTFTKNT